MQLSITAAPPVKACAGGCLSIVIPRAGSSSGIRYPAVEPVGRSGQPLSPSPATSTIGGRSVIGPL